MNIKETLLQTKEFIDNEYLDKYIELIEHNKNTNYIKFECNRHHIIPRYVFRKKNIPIDNSDNNLVNLFYKDHLLAHYYLSACAIGKGKYWNLYGLFRISGLKSCDKLNIDFIKNLDDYQKIYEEAVKAAPNHRKGTKCSLETKLKMKEASKLRVLKYGSSNSDKIWINNDEEELMIKKDEFDSYKSKGFKKGRIYRHSQEAKNKISESSKGPRSKEFCEKMRQIALNQPAKSPESIEKFKKSIKKYYETHENHFKGKNHTEKTKEINRLKHLGKIAINNGIISKMIDPDELDDYINEGWMKGYGNTRTRK